MDQGHDRGCQLAGKLLITLTLPWSVGPSMLRYSTHRAHIFDIVCGRMFLLGQFSQTPGLFAFLLVVAYACGFALTPLPYAQIVSGWFDKRRGLPWDSC